MKPDSNQTSKETKHMSREFEPEKTSLKNRIEACGNLAFSGACHSAFFAFLSFALAMGSSPEDRAKLLATAPWDLLVNETKQAFRDIASGDDVFSIESFICNPGGHGILLLSLFVGGVALKLVGMHCKIAAAQITGGIIELAPLMMMILMGVANIPLVIIWGKDDWKLLVVCYICCQIALLLFSFHNTMMHILLPCILAKGKANSKSADLESHVKSEGHQNGALKPKGSICEI